MILAVLWAAVLLPPLFRSRSERRRGNSIGVFSSQLSTISRTGGFRASSPRSLQPLGVIHPPAGARRPSGPGPVTRRRRRDVLTVLAIGTLGSVLLAVVAGVPALWALPALSAALLGTYAVLLARATAAAGERRDKVRYLEPRSAARLRPLPGSGLALRKTVSS